MYSINYEIDKNRDSIIFQNARANLKGIVKKIRPGNKLDISLGQIGYRNIEPNAKKILEALNDNSGFLPLHDKSSPEAIKNSLEMSKKNFKKAVGSLYKQRIIDIKRDGIYLV